MTAGSILKYYMRVAPAIGHKASAWVLLLTLAAAGDKGLSHHDLERLLRARSMSTSPTLRRWKKQGILVCSTMPAHGNRGGNPRVIYKATPKLYEALGLLPAEPAIGPRS
jgi:hypothetical protein